MYALCNTVKALVLYLQSLTVEFCNHAKMSLQLKLRPQPVPKGAVHQNSRCNVNADPNKEAPPTCPDYKPKDHVRPTGQTESATVDHTI